MADLLSAQMDPSGIMSLLTPIVTGGAIQPAPAGPADPNAQAAAGSAALPAWLAFARTLGSYAQPHYGPSSPIGPALADAMGAGYSTARQAQMLPALQASAGMGLQAQQNQLQMQNLALQQRQFEFDQERNMWGAFAPATAGVSAAAAPPGTSLPAGQGTPPGSLPGLMSSGPPATPAQVASLPEVQAIADPGVKQAFITAAIEQGMPLPAIAQYARQIKFESGGVMVDAKNLPITSSTGALGAAQIEPPTFADMKKQYPDITGDINDPASNVRAGMHYFNQGLRLSGGNLAGAAVYYNGGPGALGTFMQTGQPTPATASYAVSTGALPTMPKGYGTPGGPTPATDMGPPVPAQFGGQNYGTVPQQVEQQARNAALAAMRTNPMDAPNAYGGVIQTWRQNQVRPGPLPGTQISGTGQESEAPRPTQVLPMTPAEIAAIPGADPKFPWVKTVYLDDGTLAKPPEIASPRVAQSQVNNESALRQEYLANPIVSNYNQMTNYYGRMQQVYTDTNGPNASRQPSRYDDIALLHNFAHIQDPTMGTGEGREATLYEGGGLGADLQQAYARVMGGGALTDDQRQWLMQTAKSELGGQQYAAQQVLNEKRRLAGGQGSRPDQIGPENLSMPGVISAPPSTSRTIPFPPVVVGGGAAPGSGTPPPAVPSAPGTPGIAADGTVLQPSGQPMLGKDGRPYKIPTVNAAGPGIPPISTPAAGPAAPTQLPPGGAPRPGGAPPPTSLLAPSANAAQPPASTPAVDPQVAAVPNFDNAGLNALKAKMRANPSAYSEPFKQAVANEIRKRQPAQGGS